jgi:hypothetical protein
MPRSDRGLRARKAHPVYLSDEEAKKIKSRFGAGYTTRLRDLGLLLVEWCEQFQKLLDVENTERGLDLTLEGKAKELLVQWARDRKAPRSR